MSFFDFAKNKNTKELASAAKKSEATIRAYKKGTPIPSDTLLNIANYYSTTTDRVLGHVLPNGITEQEDYPSRPPQVYTITTEHQELADKYANLKETYSKALTELQDVQNKCMHLEETIKALESTPKQEYSINTPAEYTRLQELLRAIHFLSEEK